MKTRYTFIGLILLAILVEVPLKCHAQLVNLKPLTYIKFQKSAMDKLFHEAAKHNSKQIILLAKEKGKRNPIKLKNEKWPEDVVYSYNVLYDTVNHTTMILASPFSESGDWDIVYVHYFGADGRLFAFERRTGFFNSECTADGEAAHETITCYYSHKFVQIKKNYRLMDSKGKSLLKSKCSFPYNFTDYKIYNNLNDCLKGYNIPLATLKLLL